MKLRSAAVVGLVTLPALPALGATSSADPLVIVSGAQVAERASARSAWTPASNGRLHAGWEVRCPEGCMLAIGKGGTLRLEAGTEIRDQAPIFTRVGKAYAERTLRIELGTGVVRADLAQATQGVILSTRDGAEMLVPAHAAGGAVDRGGHARFAATLGELHVRRPHGRWQSIAAGRALDARGPVADHAMPKAPTWELAGLNAGPVGLAGPSGTARVGGVWAASDGATGYAIEIARDAAFTNLVADRTTDETMASAELAPGNYFARVSALDALGLAGAPSTTRALRVVAVTLPPGGLADVVGRTLVVPPARALEVADADGIEFGVGKAGFRSARSVALAPAAKTEQLWVRLRGDALSASSLTLEPRALRADVEFFPRNARWPAEPVDIVVRISDPSGRIDPTTITPKLKAMIEVDDVRLGWWHDGAVWRAHVPPHPIWQNTVLRVEATDEHDNLLGRGFAEIAPSRSEALAAR